MTEIISQLQIILSLLLLLQGQLQADLPLQNLSTGQIERQNASAQRFGAFGATEKLEVLDSVKKQELSYKKWNSDTVPIEGKVKRVNGEIVSVEPKRFVSSFNQGWKNYLDKNHEWKSINTNFVLGVGGWEMKDAPFEVFVPRLSDGTALFRNNNRWDELHNTRIDASELDMTIKALVSPVLGRLEKGDLNASVGLIKNVSYVVYENVLPDVDLIYYVHFGRSPKLEKLVRVKVARAVDISFELGFSTAIAHERGAERILIKGGREIGLESISAWDSNFGTDRNLDSLRKKTNIPFDFGKVGSKYILTKHIPSPAGWVLPLYSDVVSSFNPAAGANSPIDGWVRVVNASDVWATERNRATGDSISTTAFRPIAGMGGGLFHIGRSIAYFNTGATITDLATINATASTSLTLWESGTIQNGDNDGNDYLAVVQSFLAADNNIVTADFDAFCDATDCAVTAGVALVEGSNQLDITSILTGTSTLFVLDADGRGWIADANDTKPAGAPNAGITRIAVLEGHDILDNAYAGADDTFNGVTFFSADQGGTTQPKLDVDWTDVAGEGGGETESDFIIFN